MASSDPSQYEKELGITMEEDLAAILGSQVKDEVLQTPKRKEPPAATASVQAESINGSAPQTISSTDVNEEEPLGTGVVPTTVNAAGNGPEQFQLSPCPQVGVAAIAPAETTKEHRTSPF